MLIQLFFIVSDIFLFFKEKKIENVLPYSQVGLEF